MSDQFQVTLLSTVMFFIALITVGVLVFGYWAY